MKRVLILLAAAAMVFVGCKKENIDENKIVFGDETADITVGPCGSMAENHHVGGPGYHFDCDATIKGVSCHFFLNLSATCKGKKVNVGSYDSGVNYTFEINSSSEEGYPYDVHHYNDSNYAKEISHSSVGTWFKSGTMELKDDGKTLSLDVDAVTFDGRKFKLNITTKSQKFE